jgi:bacillolysin
MLGGPHLSFDHWVASEAGYDGGQLMISVNGAPFQLVDPAAFTYNGYNMELLPAIRGFEQFFNPRAGQPAFSGVDAGSVAGSWGTSIVDLTRYARLGDRIRLRWDFSTDYCFGTNLGWYVDNVRVYACRP